MHTLAFRDRVGVRTSGKLFWTTTYSGLLRACQPIKTLLWRPRFWHEHLCDAVRRASSYIDKFGPRAGCGFISINDGVASPCYCEEAEPHVQDVAGRIDSEKALGVARICASEVLLQIAHTVTVLIQSSIIDERIKIIRQLPRVRHPIGIAIHATITRGGCHTDAGRADQVVGASIGQKRQQIR